MPSNRPPAKSSSACSVKKKRWPSEDAQASSIKTKSICRISVNVDGVRADASLARWLKTNLKKLAALTGVFDGDIRLLLIDDAGMIELHQQHMNLPTTTDVLSFDLRDDLSDPMDADLAICLDEAKRQAGLRGHEWKMEVLLYALHGMLHMLGHDDLTKKGYQEMHRREDQLLQQAGFPPLFASGSAKPTQSKKVK